MPTDVRSRYRLAEARRLLPLVEAIAREIRERRKGQRRLERALIEGRFGDRAVATEAVRSRLAEHEEGLERACEELRALGLVPLRVDPLTVHFPGRTNDGSDVVFCWQEGDADILHGHEPGCEDTPRRPLRIRATAASQRRVAEGDPDRNQRRTAG
jgi:hypothetical protein